ncbi:nitrilase-related carbon-nitrogen hydrolase [Herbiconiux sp. P15]|uniref:nitrilase-related carbon-nitrogen hydrolase n=1 Tax=Herbiconiux liukaitaii TaxID=3342799 RepID=UPI0035B7B978
MSAPERPTREVRVRAHELAPVIADLEHNTALILDAVAGAVADGIELLVLPELSTSGYYLRDVEEARSVAITTDHDLFTRCAGLLPVGTTLVLGFCELAGGELFNSAAVLEASGVLAVYRKTHLWDDEKLLFTPGDRAPAVVDTAVGRVGTLICYDLEFPEMPRSLALAGAEIIAVPTNWPLVPRPAGERAPEVVQAMAAARASAVAIVCCDRTGDERGHPWTEGTTVLGPEGWPLAPKDASGRVDATLELDPTRTRIGPRNDVLTDRRPELYTTL